MRPLPTSGVRSIHAVTVTLAVVVSCVDLYMLSVGPSASTMMASVHDVVSYLMPIGVAGVLAAVLGARATNRLEHSFWASLGISFISLFAAEAYWTWYTVAVDADGTPPNSPVMLLYVVSLVSFASIVIRLMKPSVATPWHHVRVLTDIAAGAWAGVPIVYVGLTFPLLGELPGGSVVSAVVAAFYPVVATLIIASTIVVLGTRTDVRQQRWAWMIALSLLLLSGTLLLYPAWRVDTLSTPGAPPTWYTSLLGLCFVVFALGQSHRLGLGEGVDQTLAEQRSLPEVTPLWLTRLYPVAVSCALAWVGWLALRSGRTEWGSPLVFFAVVLSVLLTARSCLAALEGAAYRRGALTDPQTGARVRSLFDDRLHDAVNIADDTTTGVSLVVADVATSERFDAVLGHSAGESRLREALGTLASQFREFDGPYLLDSYRFAWILENTTAQQAQAIASRAWHVLASDDEMARTLDVALGVAGHPGAPGDAVGLLSAAHTAVDSARALDPEPVAMFDERHLPAGQEEREHHARMRAIREAVRVLAQAVDARDPYTKDHSTNVSELSSALAQVIGMPDADVHTIALASLVHDVGKVGVNDDILLAGEDITTEDALCLQSHAELGERILAPARIDAVLPIVRHHHERWDGLGYPDGLSGTAIPQGSRVMAVCDAFESLTSARSWRAPVSAAEALREIEESAGTAFDPAIARAFVRMVRSLASHEHGDLAVDTVGSSS